MNRRKSSGPEQQQIDFSRGDQLALLDAAPIPKVVRVEEGKGTVGVSAASIRSVLRAVDSCCRGGRAAFPSASYIAETIDRNEKTVRRALAALEVLQFVMVETRPGRSNQFRINWGELSLKRAAEIIDPPKVTPDMVTRTPDMVTRTPDMVTRTPDMVTRTPDMVTDEAYISVEETYLNDPEGRSQIRSKNLIQSGGLADRVARLFDAISYRGVDGHTLWLAWAAVDAGAIPEAAIGDAVQAMRTTKTRPRSRVGYFRQCLAKRIGISLEELQAVFASVRVMPRCPGGRPHTRIGVGDRANLRASGSPRPSNQELNDRRNALMQQLANIQD